MKRFRPDLTQLLRMPGQLVVQAPEVGLPAGIHRGYVRGLVQGRGCRIRAGAYIFTERLSWRSGKIYARGPLAKCVWDDSLGVPSAFRQSLRRNLTLIFPNTATEHSKMSMPSETCAASSGARVLIAIGVRRKTSVARASCEVCAENKRHCPTGRYGGVRMVQNRL